MPKKIDDELKARAVRLVNDHQGEYSSLTAAAAVVAKQLGVGKESVRRWVVQSQVDGGQRAGATSAELAEIKALKAKVRRLEEDNAILKSGGCRTNRRRNAPRCGAALLGWAEIVGAWRTTFPRSTVNSCC